MVAKGDPTYLGPVSASPQVGSKVFKEGSVVFLRTAPMYCVAAIG